MTGIEIVLLILGMIVFAVSFLIPEPKQKIDAKSLADGEEKIKEIVDEQMKEAKEKLRISVDETLSGAVEKTERSLERVSNEKIMAVNEYSDTVLEDINKNHQEVMFLYDMLNDKHENIKSTVSQIEKTVKEAEAASIQPPVQELSAEEAKEADRVQEAPEESQAEDISFRDEGFDKENRNEKILELHNAGRTNVEIAKELGRGVGEVKLVIDLFK